MKYTKTLAEQTKAIHLLLGWDEGNGSACTKVAFLEGASGEDLWNDATKLVEQMDAEMLGFIAWTNDGFANGGVACVHPGLSPKGKLKVKAKLDEIIDLAGLEREDTVKAVEQKPLVN